jgi:hypothetical protein
MSPCLSGSLTGTSIFTEVPGVDLTQQGNLAEFRSLRSEFSIIETARTCGHGIVEERAVGEGEVFVRVRCVSLSRNCRCMG